MKLFLSLLFTTFFLIGCSKDDEVGTTSGKSITIDGKNYSFEGAGVLDLGYDETWEEYSKFFLLTSTPITPGKELLDYSHSLILQANVRQDEFIYGTFYDDENKNQYGGIIFLENGKPGYMTSGTFTISKVNNGDTKIDVDGILMDGKQIKGTFTSPFGPISDEFIDNLFEIIFSNTSSFRIKS